MSNWKVVHQFPKNDAEGRATGAYVLIRDQDTDDTISANLVGDVSGLEGEALFDAVLADFYRRHYADKVMLETVAKVDEALKSFEDYKARQEGANARIFEEIEALKKSKKKPTVTHEVTIEEG